jgi:hypothetical protein
MFCPDDKVYKTNAEKNTRLSDLMSVKMLNKAVLSAKRVEGETPGWDFTLG